MARTGTRRLSRPYPYAYGFILGTRGADHDSIDCYVITPDSLKAGTLVECEPVGLLEQHEDGEIDNKVLAVLPGQPAPSGSEVFEQLRGFIYEVFSANMDVRVHVGPLLPREAALAYIQSRQQS